MENSTMIKKALHILGIIVCLAAVVYLCIQDYKLFTNHPRVYDYIIQPIVLLGWIDITIDTIKGTGWMKKLLKIFD